MKTLRMAVSMYHNNALIRLGLRLTAARKALAKWSLSDFSYIFQKVKRAEDEVCTEEMEILLSNNAGSRSMLNAAKANLEKRSLLKTHSGGERRD